MFAKSLTEVSTLAVNLFDHLRCSDKETFQVTHAPKVHGPLVDNLIRLYNRRNEHFKLSRKLVEAARLDHIRRDLRGSGSLVGVEMLVSLGLILGNQRLDLPGHDPNYIAMAGILGITGTEDGKIALPSVPMADLGGGSMQATVGILCALLARERTGRGQYIDIATSCLGCQVKKQNETR